MQKKEKTDIRRKKLPQDSKTNLLYLSLLSISFRHITTNQFSHNVLPQASLTYYQVLQFHIKFLHEMTAYCIWSPCIVKQSFSFCLGRVDWIKMEAKSHFLLWFLHTEWRLFPGFYGITSLSNNRFIEFLNSSCSLCS